MNNFSDKRGPIPISEKVISLSEKATRFIDAIVALRPAIAVFDCDDTLWKGDSGKGFMDWEIENKIVSDKVAAWARVRYAEYVQGKVSEEDMCGEMVAWHKGTEIAVLEDAGERYFVERVEKQVFPEMQELVARLINAGCDVWAVSSTNEWVIRAGVSRYGIRADHVLAVSLESKNGIATEKLIRVPTGEGKAVAVRQFIGGQVDMVFGNSVHDAAMLGLARHAYAVNPNPDLKRIAQERGWTIYEPD
ncbi:MAG TPA: haloacid dehalogenase-like hydrolase [Terriglobales bacterium]|jgi:phosphoserine phosphatase|nr:haloacid dehalogenase-like hydrolase [Terriglobales bacterium]